MAYRTTAPPSPLRRQALGKLGALGLLALFGHESAGAARQPGTCVLIPEETEGPFPLHAILRDPAMRRTDITEGKAGVPLTLVLNLQNVQSGCAPVSNAAVYVWHCDKDGQYSGYSVPGNGSHRGETFLRGVQLSDANGQARFTTIYPGWYPGRITHIHFQVFVKNGAGAPAAVTSQLAFPQGVTETVYRSALYTRGQNTSVTSIADDGIFSNDGAAHQIVAVRGDPAGGYVAMLNVGLAA